MQIKTLAEILAESDSDSASSAVCKNKQRNKTHAKPASKSPKRTQTEIFEHRKSKKAQRSSKKDTDSNKAQDQELSAEPHLFAKPSQAKANKRRKNKKRFHAAAPFIAELNDAPAYQPPKSQTIKQMLSEIKENSEPLEPSSNDNLPSALKAYLRTPEQKQREIDEIKAESRLRWLAFYYLSRREYGKAELKQKLIDKEQDIDKIDALLTEFEEKGYQSDYRTTLMLIRENIRKGRGRERIKQAFYNKKIAMPSNIDELIDMANNESEEFSEFVDDDADSLVTGVDWLRLAVEARSKKYGDTLPVEQKDKARQLRFLQYRGFKSDVCFQALNYTVETLEERF